MYIYMWHILTKTWFYHTSCTKSNSKHENLNLSNIDKTLKLLEENKRENIIYLGSATDENKKHEL